MEVVDPVEVPLLHLLRVDLDLAVADGVTGGLGERADLDPPLQGQPRLDRRLAARAVADGVGVRTLLGDDPALGAQRADDRGTGLQTVKTLERAMHGDDRVLVHDREIRQAVALSDLEVVRVVGRGDLDGARAELGVDVLVGDDRDPAAGERQFDLRADEVGVALVVGVNGDSGVTEHRLGPSRRDDDRRVAFAVTDRDELTLVVLVLHLDVGDGGQTARAPVDDALGTVDQLVVVEPLEDRLDGLGETLVHGEALTAPVDTVAEAAHLAGDLPAGLRLPLPDPLDESLTAEVVADLPSLASSRSTTFWVAIPAWSMPGCHSVSYPCIRLRRVRASISVCSKAWPRCREPVTLGGGITMVYAGFSLFASASK